MTEYTSGRNIGRQICVSPEALMYRLTGRSEESQRRKIVIEGTGKCNYYDFRLCVRHIDNLPREKAAILEYPAIIKLYSDRSRLDMFVAGNGVHTEDMAIYMIQHNLDILDFDVRYMEAAEKILQKHGVEPDRKTPRTLALVRPNGKTGLFRDVLFASIHPKPHDEPRADGLTPGKVRFAYKKLLKNTFETLATYSAQGPGLDDSKGQIGSLYVPERVSRMSAKRLARWGFEDLQNNYFVVKEDGTKVDTAVSVGVVTATEDAIYQYEIDKHNKHDD